MKLIGDDKFIKYIQGHIKTGDFTLSCNKKSKYLIDLAQFLRTDNGRCFLTDYEFPRWAYNRAGGPLSGADLICPYLKGDGWFGVRNTAKGRGTDRGRITGNLNPGEKVVMVEDVCTSGRTLISAAEEVLHAGGKIIGAIVLVDRIEHGGVDAFRGAYQVPVHVVCTFYEN